MGQCLAEIGNERSNLESGPRRQSELRFNWLSILISKGPGLVISE